MINLFPCVSVVMPAYNSEQFIVEAIDSVLGQTFSDLELIVVDDGSKDGTADLVRIIAAQDKRVKLLVQENSGRPSIARNRGIELATGEYIAFLDSDDYWFPMRVEKMVAALKAHPDWVAAFHDLKLVDVAGNDLGEVYLADAGFLTKAQRYLKDMKDGWWECNDQFYVFMSLYFAAIHTQSIMIARTRLPNVDVKFDSQFVICEDTDLWVRIAMLGRLGFLNDVLSAYRQHEMSIVRDQLRFATQSVIFHKHNLNRLMQLLSPDEISKYNKKLANYIRALGFVQYELYDLRSARSAYWKSLMIDFQLTDLIALGKTLIPPVILHLLHRNDS